MVDNLIEIIMTLTSAAASVGALSQIGRGGYKPFWNNSDDEENNVLFLQFYISSFYAI